MLEVAEAKLARPDEDGHKILRVFIHEADVEQRDMLQTAGYIHTEERDRTMSRCDIPDSEVDVADGFELRSLGEVNDLGKVNRVMWRGFNHPGEPPEDIIPFRKRMQSSPNFRFDLTLVALAPNGDYASYCGMWYDAVNRFGYVEPVATDPDYRRMGLGKAVVTESMKRCGRVGAKVIYVGSGQPFYRSMGFEPLYEHHCWTKSMESATFV